MIKVSVIIPVYNGELHLRQCLDSVCNQTLKEIEIICVDDGSTDSSFEILKEYQAKDNRIQLFRQQNLYAGAARNLGMQNATGKYLIFWDCDDFFEIEALSVMYQRMEECKADVCVCSASQYLQEKDTLVPHVVYYLNTKKIPKEEPFNRETNEAYILNFTNEAAWNKMFCREFVEKIGLEFQPVRNGNDVYFTVNALCQAERIVTVDKAFINYRKNQKQSLVGTISRSPLTPFQAWLDSANNLKKIDKFPEQSFVNRALGSFTYLLRNLREKEAFTEAVTFLQNGVLEKLSIQVRDEEYYYSKRYKDFVKHLLEDTPEDFHAYLAFETYIEFTERSADKMIQGMKLKERNAEIKILSSELKSKEKAVDKLKKEQEKATKKIAQLQMEKEKTEKELKRIKDSWAYKIGRKILWLPSKLKNFLKRKH